MKHLSSWRHESGNARLYISLLWLAPLVLNSLHPPARSAQARSCRSRGVWRSKTSALTLEFALQKSTFPSSRLFQLPQGLAANYKNLFVCRHAEEQGMGWGGGISGGNSQVKPLKYETVKKTGRRKSERERIFWHWSSTQRLWLWGEIWSGAQRIMLVCSRSQVIVERMCKSTHCSTFAQAEAFSERKGFTIRLKKPTLCVSTV